MYLKDKESNPISPDRKAGRGRRRRE